MNLSSKTVGDLATLDLVTISPNAIMTEVDKIFESSYFHHLPVVNDSGKCIGVISKSDFYQLQDCFTKSKTGNYKKNNHLLFRSLLASEVMTSEITSLDLNCKILEAIDIFLENKVHSIVILKENQLYGILTPNDLLVEVKNYLVIPDAIYIPYD